MMSWGVNIPFFSFSVRSFIPLYQLFIHTVLSAFQYNENNFFSNSLISFHFLLWYHSYSDNHLRFSCFISSSTFSIEDSSPYHLHHGDGPRTVLVSQFLDGDNYHTWSRSMVMALTSKNKLSFLNGSLGKPSDESGTEYHAWIRCNIMVTSWLLNFVSRDIATSVIYIDNAADVWTDLNERFSQKNGPRIYQIQKSISSLSQDDLFVGAYFTSSMG
jgi:hypothetical protein